MSDTAAPRLSVRIRVQITLIALIATASLLAAHQFSEASGTYQEAVRQDVKRQAAVLEDIRAVYGEEAPLAFEVAVAQARADGLRPLRDEGRLAASEYALAAQTAFGLRNTEKAHILVGSDRYRHRNLGYDLAARLADEQKRHPELYALNPDATRDDGDRAVLRGLICAGIAGAAVLALILAALILRPQRLRRPSAQPGRRVLRGLDLVPQPATAIEHRRTVLLHLAISVLLLLLPLGQLFATGVEQRAQAEAARRALSLDTSIAAHAQRSAFLTTALQTAVLQDLRSTARERASLDTGVGTEGSQHESTVALAEADIAQRTQAIAEYMGRPPTAEDGVDTATVTALREKPENLTTLRDAQAHQVHLAEGASRRGTFLTVATAVAVVAEILATTALAAHARARGHGRRWAGWALAGAATSTALTCAALL